MIMARVRRGAPATATPARSGLPLARLTRLVVVLLVAVVVVIAFRHLVESTPSRGPAIRDALVAAAAKLKSLPANTSQDAVTDALAPLFRSFDARIDASRFPAEADVTLRGLDGVTCLQSEDLTRRIEGSVVVMLEGYGEPASCRSTNAMTWRLLP
jgi:hypothetical protein